MASHKLLAASLPLILFSPLTPSATSEVETRGTAPFVVRLQDPQPACPCAPELGTQVLESTYLCPDGLPGASLSFDSITSGNLTAGECSAQCEATGSVCRLDITVTVEFFNCKSGAWTVSPSVNEGNPVFKSGTSYDIWGEALCKPGAAPTTGQASIVIAGNSQGGDILVRLLQPFTCSPCSGTGLGE